MVEIKFLLTRDVKRPRKAFTTDAGIDFFVPEFDLEFINDLTKLNKRLSIVTDDDGDKYIEIEAHQQILMPMGLKSIIPKGWCVVFHNKSGIASKKRLVVGAHVIDADYREEWILNLQNLSDDNVHIKFGQKIVQGLVHKVPEVKIDLISEDEFKKYLDVERNGGFGSTGV